MGRFSYRSFDMQVKWVVLNYFNHWNRPSGLYYTHSSIVYESAHINAAKYFVVSEIRRQMQNRISAITCRLAAIFGALRFLPFSHLWLRSKYNNHLAFSWIEIIETWSIFNFRICEFLSIHLISFVKYDLLFYLDSVTIYLTMKYSYIVMIHL